MRAPLTPLKAFVHDAEKLGDSAQSSDNDARLSHWFSVAQAAERLATLAPNERPEYLKALGSALLPERAGRPTQVEGDGRAPSDPLGQLAERLRLEAEDMERGSCFELALITVSSVCQMVASEPTGRLLATAHLGRVNRQMGDLDSAVDCYRTVTDDALSISDGPVASHGYIGLGNVAHSRGNRPDQKRFFDEALRLAAVGSVAEMSAHQGLLVVATSLGQLGDALLHGWRAHDLAPPSSDTQLSILGGIASVAREAGFYSASLAGLDFVIENAKLSSMRLPAIGGAIRAAARCGDAAGVRKYELLGRSELSHIAQPFEISRFLLWAAESWQILEQSSRVLPLVEEAMQVAQAYGFHEIELLAEALKTTASRTVRSDHARKAWEADANVITGIRRLAAMKGS